MWKDAFNGFRLVHGALLALAAVGFFRFWGRTRFWLPKYVHVLAGFGLAIGLWGLYSAPADAPISKQGPLGQLLLALALPAMVYFFFVFYGGQREAFHRTFSTELPCPFCRRPVRARQLDATGASSGATSFAEPQCPHCGHTFT